METNNKTAPITQEKDRNAISLPDFVIKPILKK